MIWLHWIDKRGAGRGKSLRPDEVASAMSKLRCPARLDLNGETIGGIEEANGGQDDQRVRWIWWFDNEAVRGQSAPSRMLGESR